MDECRVEVDIERNGFCFSDGIGRISPSFARRVSLNIGLGIVPSAFQVFFFSMNLNNIVTMDIYCRFDTKGARELFLKIQILHRLKN